MRYSILLVIGYVLTTCQVYAHSMMTNPRGRGNVEWWGTCGKSLCVLSKQYPASNCSLTVYVSAMKLLGSDATALATPKRRKHPFLMTQHILSSTSVAVKNSPSNGTGSTTRGDLFVSRWYPLRSQTSGPVSMQLSIQSSLATRPIVALTTQMTRSLGS